MSYNGLVEVGGSYFACQTEWITVTKKGCVPINSEPEVPSKELCFLQICGQLDVAPQYPVEPGSTCPRWSYNDKVRQSPMLSVIF
jgi:hypothetical protein